MASFTTTSASPPQATNINTTTTQINEAMGIVNSLIPVWSNFWGQVRGIFGNSQLNEAEREIALQQQIYNMQLQQQQKQQQTIIIAAVVCVMAVIITALFARK